MTDVLTGWTFTRSIRNNAEKHIISALDAAVGCVPFPVLGMDFDNGSEFINHSVVRWAGDLDIYFTRSRPYRKNDQATIESKNNHLVRRYAFYYRYDTSEEREVLGRLWEQVNVKLNSPRPPPASPSDGAPIRPAGASASTTLLVPHWTGCWTPAPRPRPRRLTWSRTATSSTPPLSPAASSSSRTFSSAWPRTRPTSACLAQIPSILPDVHKGVRVRKAS